MKILVIGGGLAGVQTAYFLLQDGHQVTLVERRENFSLETSFANGGLITPSHAAPWNSPGIIKTLLSSIGKKDASIYVRLSALGQYLGWGRQFVRNSTRTRYNRTIERNFALAHYSQHCFHNLLSNVPLEFSHAKSGSIMTYTTQSNFEAAKVRFNELKRHGVPMQICSPDDLISLEPALSSSRPTIVGGVYYQDDEHGNAREFTQSLGQYLANNGVEMRLGVHVDGFLKKEQKITGIKTDKGDLLADRIVVAAGHWSANLLKGLGINLPVRPVKGSSLTYHLPDWTDAPKIPVVDDDAHVAVTPIGEHIRIVGTAEFSGYDPEVRPERMSLLRRSGIAIYPQLKEIIANIEPALEWSGHRPMTPDCMPILGASGYDNLYLNTGHGYLGWTTGTGTSQAVADMIAGRETGLEVGNYSLNRF